MPRMIDLIRASAVPSNLMQSAARGALSIPQPEMIEVLVELATKNQVFAEQASFTLAGWDEASLRAAAANPKSPRDVLEYLISPQNLRPGLLPILLENPSVAEESIAALAKSATREQAGALLQSERVSQSASILRWLESNLNLSGVQSASVKEKLTVANRAIPFVQHSISVQAAPVDHSQIPATPMEQPQEVTASAVFSEAGDSDPAVEESLTAYLTEHTAEIAAQANKPFQPIGGAHDGSETEEPAPVSAATDPTTAAATPTAESTAKKVPLTRKSSVSAAERGSALQKIAQLDVKGRIQLALKGTKEERSLLIRDGTKVVALAVLESPKVSESEVEKYASQKNVLEAVLRTIPLKRRYMKHYGIVRNLVFNPRTPLDVSLGLMKNILVNDLKNLSANKEVSDTVRKLAIKMFKQKMDTKKKD